MTTEDGLAARGFRRDRLAQALEPGRRPLARALVGGLLAALLTAGGMAAPGLVDQLQSSAKR